MHAADTENLVFFISFSVRAIGFDLCMPPVLCDKIESNISIPQNY